jgi:two-component system cell cycle sensor histidine kinase/response regulator CckA
MSKTVLIVDDMEEIRDSLAEILRILGLNAITASNGREGKNIIESGAFPVDVILSDFEMGPINGEEFYNGVKESGIPFILMSSHKDIQTIAKKLGVAFVRKPYSIETLRQILL